MRRMGKRGIGAIANNTVNLFIGLVVLFLLAAELVPEVVNAGNNLSATGAPLASLFSGTGIAILLVMVGLFLTVVRMVQLRK